MESLDSEVEGGLPVLAIVDGEAAESRDLARSAARYRGRTFSIGLAGMWQAK